MKQLIALALLLASFSVYAQQYNPQCTTQWMLNQQTNSMQQVWVCPNGQYPAAPPTIIYSSPSPPAVVYVEPRPYQYVVPFVAGVGTAIILRGGHGHWHHR